MGKISGEAGRTGQGAPRRRADKAQGSGRGRTARQQFHLGADTIRRLGVHAALVGRDRSGVVQDVLDAWLRRYGQGRELFGPVEMDDRPTAPGPVSPDADDAA